MNIISKHSSVHAHKSEGIAVDYYLRDEYEILYCEQAPYTEQEWHAHVQIFESIFILSGELTAKWQEDIKNMEVIVRAGDLIEVEDSVHSFYNHTDATVTFLVLKQVLSGTNKRDIFKHDKVIPQEKK